MVRQPILVLLLVIAFISEGRSQMLVGPDTLIGNEWINFGQSYYKFTIATDGVYRIPYATLQAAGLTSTPGSDYRVYSYGKQIPLYVSTDGLFGPDDFIEFYGLRNKGELDRFLFRHPDDDMLNPEYSMYTDQRTCFLTNAGSDTPARVSLLPNDTSNPPQQQPHYIHKEILEYTAGSNDPYYSISGGGAISYSSYLHGEGFCKASESNSFTTVNTSHRASSGMANLHIRVTSTNALINQQHEFLFFWNGELLDTIAVYGIRIIDTSFTIPLDKIQDENVLNITNNNSLSRHSLVRVELSYPRLTTMDGQAISYLQIDHIPGPLYYRLDDFNHQDVAPLIYSSDGQYRMVSHINPTGQAEWIWPADNPSQTLVVTDQTASITLINHLERKSFVDYTGDDMEYVVITHPDLMAPGTDSEYLQYRLSAEGGGYKGYAYSILELYDQFGYGIDKHPMAIRNFIEFIHRHWPSARMIFLVGRGIEYHRSRENNGTWESLFFVPTFGRPGGDNLLASTNWELVPRFPIGRLAITAPDQLTTYLDKVRAHDQARHAGQTPHEKNWIKNVMHLGGGKTSAEQSDFEFTLGLLDTLISASGYGANVHFFQKKSTEEIGETQSAQVLDLLHEGCGIISYLGHSATSTFEFQINDPTEWNNKGRYPIFSAMGCSAGQIHGTSLSLSDTYVRVPEEGAVAFISGSGSQFPSALVTWAKPWYNFFGNLEYGCTLGESILFGLKALKFYIDPDRTSQNAYRFLLEQQTFHGDPALQLHPLPGPDYLVDRNSISLTPNILNTKLDSFQLHFSIDNIGRNLQQTVPYCIHLQAADGSIVELARDSVVADDFSAEIHIRVPLLTQGKSGVFRLLIAADPYQQISELPAPDAEMNNQLVDNLGVEGVTIYVVDDLITAAYPPDFSIVNDIKPMMTATGSNAFSEGQRVAFEIDTTALFNSPKRYHDVMESEFSTYSWSPDYPFTPGQVYYWRVSTDSLSPEQPFLWSKRSFIFQPESFPGWNQSDFYQYTDNTLIQLMPDSSGFDFQFDQSSVNFNILNRFHDIAQGLIPKVTIDGIIKAEFFTGFRNRNVQAFVVAIDSLTGSFMLNPNPGLYGSSNHLGFDAPCFAYRMDLPESRQAMIDFVENIIPEGHYVFFYTYQHPMYPDFYPESWEEDEANFGKSIFSMIENQYPSSAIRTLAMTGSKPYIVFFQKNRGGLMELIAADSADVISMNLDLKSSLSLGRFQSALAGPASQWYSILQATSKTASDTSGTQLVSAIALSADLSDTLQISSYLTSADTLIADLDAGVYPYIQLNYETGDSIAYDPGMIQHWRVHYEGYPEFVIQPKLGFEFNHDTLLQGQVMTLKTYVQNLSPYTVDSLPVSLQIIGEDNAVDELFVTLKDVEAFGQYEVAFEKNTAGYSGDYQLIFGVNPDHRIKEFNYNNNTGLLNLHVLQDKSNPLLDVTFDGFHIQDGDIVSAKPMIMVQLADENQLLRLTDTSSFTLYLEYPSDLNPRRIYFSYPWVTFIPAETTGPNQAYVQLTPDLFEEGYYRLIANAKDGSGNASGDVDYMVSFEVVQAETMSYIYNFPNPFTTSTRFIYTATGSGSPYEYSIEIFNAMGIKVREISQEEIGPMPPGHHMTTYAWDGTNQTGAPLSAGMYLYRLVAKDENGNSLPRYNAYGQGSSSDQEWGKMMIIR